MRKRRVAVPAKRSHFKVGDAIFYPSAGVGVIQGVEDVYIGGSLEACYVISFPETRMVIKLPKTNIEKNGVRPLLDNRKLKDLFKILAARSKRRATTGNWTERCKQIERKINSGSYLELGEVVRDLAHWKKQSGLSFEESMLFETACNYLVREVAAVQGTNTDVARDRIYDCIGLRP
jgi:CarD family transcriptional regulator